MIPLIHDLEGKSVAIFGGGELGTHKADLFADQTELYVVGNSFTERLTELGVSLVRSSFSSKKEVSTILDEIGEVVLVLTATGDLELDELISKASHEHGALVNKVDGPVEDVITPSIIDHYPLLVAISTRGSSPAMSKHLRKQIEPLLSKSAPMVKLQSELREKLKGKENKKQLLWQVIEDQNVWQALENDYGKAKKLALKVVEKHEK